MSSSLDFFFLIYSKGKVYFFFLFFYLYFLLSLFPSIVPSDLFFICLTILYITYFIGAELMSTTLKNGKNYDDCRSLIYDSSLLNFFFLIYSKGKDPFSSYILPVSYIFPFFYLFSLLLFFPSIVPADLFSPFSIVLYITHFFAAELMSTTLKKGKSTVIVFVIRLFFLFPC